MFADTRLGGGRIFVVLYMCELIVIWISGISGWPLCYYGGIKESHCAILMVIFRAGSWSTDRR